MNNFIFIVNKKKNGLMGLSAPHEGPDLARGPQVERPSLGCQGPFGLQRSTFELITSVRLHCLS